MYQIKMSDWSDPIKVCNSKTELTKRLSDVFGVSYFHTFDVKEGSKFKVIHGIRDLIDYVLEKNDEIEIFDDVLSRTGSFKLKIIQSINYELFEND
jgi:hypothetical protein